MHQTESGISIIAGDWVIRTIRQPVLPLDRAGEETADKEPAKEDVNDHCWERGDDGATHDHGPVDRAGAGEVVEGDGNDLLGWVEDDDDAEEKVVPDVGELEDTDHDKGW